MSDVGKVMGPSGSPDPSEKKESAADAEKFAQARKRVSEVSNIDPDEQKKRKRQEEAEEEEALPEPQVPTPPSQVPPFLLTQEPKEVGLLGTQQSSSSETRSFTQTPQHFFFSEQTEENASPNLENQTPPSSEQTTPSYSENLQPPSTEQNAAPPQELDTKPSSERRTESSTEENKKKLDTPLKLPLEVEKKQHLPQDTTTFFEQLKKKEEPELKQPLEEKPPLPTEEIKKTVPSEAFIDTESLLSLPPPNTPLTKPLLEEKRKELAAAESRLEGGVMAPLAEGALPLITPPESIASLSSYSRLSPQIQEMFDKMVGVMTVMNLSGMTETTFTLNASKFASSVFFGAQIIIREFSTAPQAFNVQLNGSMQAVALFQANADDLMAAFQAGNYNFRINRLETNYLSQERPLFKRKEGDEQNSGQEKGKG